MTIVGQQPALDGIRAFFFDLDGTLADSATGLQGSIQYAFEANGLRMPVDDVRPLIGPGIRKILERMEPDLSAERIDALERSFRLDYDGEGVLRTVMFDGAEKLLRELRARRAKLFVVTNKPSVPTERLLKHTGLYGLFDAVLSRNSREPAFATKGDMICILLQEHGLDPAESVVIGDTAEDLAAATESGARFIHASYGYGQVADANFQKIEALAEMLDLLHPNKDLNSTHALAGHTA